MKKTVIVLLIVVLAIAGITASGAIFQITTTVNSGKLTANVDDRQYDEIRFAYDSIESDLNVIMTSFTYFVDAYDQSMVPNFGRYFSKGVTTKTDLPVSELKKKQYALAYYEHVNQPAFSYTNAKIIDMKVFVIKNPSDRPDKYDVAAVYIKYLCTDAEGKNKQLEGTLLADGTYFLNMHYNKIDSEALATGVYVEKTN